MLFFLETFNFFLCTRKAITFQNTTLNSCLLVKLISNILKLCSNFRLNRLLSRINPIREICCSKTICKENDDEESLWSDFQTILKSNRLYHHKNWYLFDPFPNSLFFLLPSRKADFTKIASHNCRLHFHLEEFSTGWLPVILPSSYAHTSQCHLHRNIVLIVKCNCLYELQ